MKIDLKSKQTVDQYLKTICKKSKQTVENCKQTAENVNK